MKTVTVPGYGDVEFPDTMSDEQIGAAIKAQPQFKPAQSIEQRQVEEVQSPRWNKFLKRDLPMMAVSAATTGGAGQLAQKAATTLAPKVPAGLQALLKAFPMLGEVLGNIGAKTGETLAYEGQLPSQREVKGAAAAPAVGRMTMKGVGALGKGVEKIIPGYRWGLKDLAVKELEQLPKTIPAPPSKPLYKQLDESFKTKGAPLIPVPKMAAQTEANRAEFDNILRSLRENKMHNVADDLESLMIPVTDQGGSVTAMSDLQRLFENLKRLGPTLGATSKVGGDRNLIKLLYGAAREDIKGAGASVPEAAWLAEATQRKNKEVGIQNLERWARQATSRNPVSAEKVPKPGMLMDRLADPDRAKMVANRLTPEEVQGLMQKLQELTKIAPLPSDSSWYNWLRRTIGGSVLGTGVGAALGNPAYGATGGALLGASAAEGIEQLMRTPAGRKLAQRIYQNRLGGPGSAILGSAIGQGVD